MQWITQIFRWLSRIFKVGLRWFSRIFGSGSETGADLRNIVNQTERVSVRLFLIAALVLLAVVIVGTSEQVVWALTAALASATIGGALGLLFGLPTAETKRAVIVTTQAIVPLAQAVAGAANPGPAGAETPAVVPQPDSAAQIQEELDIGYRDSTSLEQIADWLTKIIVGLTLTQFATWEEKFQNLASNLTETMIGPTATCTQFVTDLKGDDLLGALGSPICRSSAVPGGMLIALFATLGFLISYLWMRRYFILEMVIAKKQTIELLKAKSAEIREKAALQAELDRERGLREAENAKIIAEQNKTIEAASKVELAEQSPGRSATTDPEIVEILNRGLERLAENSKAYRALINIRKKVASEETDPDDPWRGKFGESATAEGVLLDASVTPVAGDAFYFEVHLRVRAETEQHLGKKVLYFLHPTFGGHPRISSFGSDGSAPLELYAYGAFTVGALLEDGTALELNLATLEDSPARFRAQ